MDDPEDMDELVALLLLREDRIRDLTTPTPANGQGGTR